MDTAKDGILCCLLNVACCMLYGECCIVGLLVVHSGTTTTVLGIIYISQYCKVYIPYR
jgi:uncharacterized protein involved in propanediol utilization